MQDGTIIIKYINKTSLGVIPNMLISVIGFAVINVILEILLKNEVLTNL